MNTTVSYIISFTLAIGFHAAVIGLLMMNWDNQEAIQNVPVEQYYIEANLVDENPFDAKKREEQAKKDKERRRRLANEKAADKNKARLRQEAIELAKKQDVEKQLAEQKKLEEQRARELAEQKLISEPEKDMESPETERKEMELNLAMSIRKEQGARRAITDDEKALAYVYQIQQDIINNWSRPPSARNGMKALLRVILVPTGEVVNVTVEESSGNDAFDRSAILAVQKAQRFQVPAKSRQFERDFREFTVLFRPEDLRL